MKTLHLYILRETVSSLILTVAVFTGLLLLATVVKELLGVLVGGGAGVGLLLKATGLLIPYILIFALPVGMLLATLLVFGRMSADQELTAIRAGGIGLIPLITPLLGLALLMSALCAWINLEFGPRSRQLYKAMIEEFGAVGVVNMIPEKTFIRFDRDATATTTVYVGENNEGQLRDLTLYEIENGRVAMIINAREGEVSYDAAAGVLHIVARNGTMLRDDIGVPFDEIPASLDIGAARSVERPPKLSNMSLRELLAKKDELETTGVDATPVKVRIHSKIAFSFACIGFTLIGIPLGIQAHRKETSVGVLMAIGLAIVFYGCFSFAESFDGRPGPTPYALIWGPVFAFQIIGLALLVRADRGMR